MTEPIKPALTAEEWKSASIGVDSYYATVDGNGAEWVGYEYNERVDWSARRHAVAALALYNQPFGFTHEDVRRLREEADGLEAWYPNEEGSLQWMRELADRIAALLPEKK